MSPRRRQIIACLMLALMATHSVRGGGFSWIGGDQPSPGPNSLVLVCAESAPSPPYTKNQFSALARVQNGDIRNWVKENYAKDGLRVFDPDDKIADQDQVFKDGFTPAAAPLPWVRTFNGSRWTTPVTFNGPAELGKAIGVGA